MQQRNKESETRERSPRCPVVYHPASLADFILFALYNHAPPTTLIVCIDRQSFLQQLMHSIEEIEKTSEADATATPSSRKYLHPLLRRTIGLLSASRSVHLAFCKSVPALHAYLSVLPRPGPVRDAKGNEHGTPMLAMLNMVALHRETPSFSAQGLSRAFAAAVEAAYRATQRLVVVECADLKTAEQGNHEVVGADSNIISDVDIPVDERDGTANGRRSDKQERSACNPWEEEISILNASTKTFGLSSDRAFMRRNVMVADVARRWCVFEQLPSECLNQSG